MELNKFENFQKKNFLASNLCQDAPAINFPSPLSLGSMEISASRYEGGQVWKEDEEVHVKSGQEKYTEGDADIFETGQENDNRELETIDEETSKPFACPHCSYRGKCWSYLRTHMSKTHKNKDFFCEDCGAAFSNAYQLLRHQEIHSDQVPFECLVCGCNFKQIEALNEHMMTHTSLKQISCDFCDYGCKNQNQLEIHIDSHKYRGLFQCKECEFRCKTREHFQQHLQKHKMKALHSCSICSVVCKSQVELQQHILTHANQKAFSCEHCDFQCETKPELNSHLLIHTEINPFVCSLCDFSCRSKTVLIKHTITHMNDEDDNVDQSNLKTSVKDASVNSQLQMVLGKTASSSDLKSTSNRRTSKEPDNCEVERLSCMKVVGKQETGTGEDREDNMEEDGKYIVYLKSEEKTSSSGFDPIEEALIEGRIPNPHVVTVVNETAPENKIFLQGKEMKDATTNDYFYHPERHQFYCTHCQYSCKRMTYLKRHLKTHAHLEYLSCPHCEDIFKTNDQLTEHMAKHSEEVAEIRPFPCDECGFRSKTKADLKRHLITHLEVKPFACTVCPYRCARKARLQNHMRIHSNAETFSCRLCKYKCGSRHILYNHVKRHMNRKLHLCPHCNFRSLTKALLKKHLQQDHPDRRPYACDICSFTCWLRSDMKKHEWLHAGLKPFKCEECDYKCRRINRLREHMLIHKNVKPYKCKKCSYATRSKHCLLNHVDEHHQNKEVLQTVEKSKGIKSKASYKLVVRLRQQRTSPLRKIEKRSMKPENESCYSSNLKKVKTEEDIDNPDVHFEENNCTLNSENTIDVSEKSQNLVHVQPDISVENDLTLDSDIDENNKLTAQSDDQNENDDSQAPEKIRSRQTLICTLCSYVCDRPSRLNRHMAIHTTDRPFQCHLCDYTGKTEDNLRKHIKRHSLAKQKRGKQMAHKCSLCSYVGKRPSDLKVHMAWHVKEQPYKCNQCDLTFKTDYNLQQHMKRHSNPNYFSKVRGQKVFRCTECTYTCNRRSRLTRHMARHTTDRPYKCNQCDQTYKTEDNLRQHFKHCPMPGNSNVVKVEENKVNSGVHGGDTPDPESANEVAVKKVLENLNEGRQVRGQKGYSCPLCSYIGPRPSILKRHMACHTTVRPHKCSQCDLSFKTEGNLKQHTQRCKGPNFPKKVIVNKSTPAEKDNNGDTDIASTQNNTEKDCPDILFIRRKVKGQVTFHCTLCSYVCDRHSRLIRHMSSHTTGRPYKCDQCDISFKTEENLRKHSKRHLNQSFLKKIKAEENIVNPDVRIDNDDNLDSKNSDTSEKNNSENLTAKRTIKGPKNFNCTLCSFVSKSLCHLKRHMSCHTTIRPYKCDQCDRTFKRRDCLRIHSKRHSGLKPYSCKFCKYRCYEQGDLNAHLLTHTDFKPLKCHLCDYACRKKFRLKEHIRTHSEVKVRPFLCSECGASFCSNAKLKQHIFRHNTPKNIQCPQCNFKCRLQTQLAKHMKRHEPGYETGPKPFLCTECGLSFHSKCSLRHHIIIHSGEKPWSCEQCSFRGRTKGQLRSHMIKHLETKPFACEYCTFTCKHKSSLERHTKMHTTREPLQCQFCDFNCVTNYDMQRHMRNKHKQENGKVPSYQSTKQPPIESNSNQTSENVVYVVEIADNAFSEPVDFVDKQMEFSNRQMEFTAGKSMNYSVAVKPLDYTQNSPAKAVEYPLPRYMDYGAGKFMDNNAGKFIDNNAGKFMDNNTGKFMDNNAGKSMMDYTTGKSVEYSSDKNYTLKYM